MQARGRLTTRAAMPITPNQMVTVCMMVQIVLVLYAGVYSLGVKILLEKVTLKYRRSPERIWKTSQVVLEEVDPWKLEAKRKVKQIF